MSKKIEKYDNDCYIVESDKGSYITNRIHPDLDDSDIKSMYVIPGAMFPVLLICSIAYADSKKNIIPFVLFIILVILGVATFVKWVVIKPTKRFYFSGQKFKGSIFEIALKNNDLETMILWNNFLIKVQPYYLLAKENNLDEANTLKACFSEKFPKSSDEIKVFREFIIEIQESIDNKLSLSANKKNAEENKNRTLKNKLLKKINSNKAGLQITDGSYVWNPKELTNVGELR